MAEKNFSHEINSLREQQMEEGYYGQDINFGGTAAEFCDLLAPEERDFFNSLSELAEGKRKWVKMFDKLQKQISEREFDEAYETFELLSEEIS